MDKRKNLDRFIKFTFIPIVLILISLACSTSGKLVTLNISESNLDLLVGDPEIVFDGIIRFNIESLVILEDRLRLEGRISDGHSNQFAGYFDLILLVERGEISAEVTGYEFPGLSVDPQWIPIIEDRIVKSINNAASQNSPGILFDEIVYLENGIQIRFRFPAEATPTHILN